MLAVSTLRNTNKDENQGQMVESFTIDTQEFPDFSDTNLLDSIDFDDLFVGINDGDVLPDLEMDPEILADFSVSGGEESEINTSVSVENKVGDNLKKEEEDKASGSSSGSGSGLGSSKGDEIVSKREEPAGLKTSTGRDGDKGRKSSAQTKNNNNQGKRKVKVMILSSL